MERKIVVFDLDDTLYQEIDFVKSAFGEIAERLGRPELCLLMLNWFMGGNNAFEELNSYLGINVPIQEYLQIYRLHKPNIKLSPEVRSVLDTLTLHGCVLGIITDGRGVSQMNKIESLGLLKYMDVSNIIVSEIFGTEKPSMSNYLYFEHKYPNAEYFYVGDNLQKDFYAPNCLSWHTVMLKDNGRNIHQSVIDNELYAPKYTINCFSELLGIVYKDESE